MPIAGGRQVPRHADPYDGEPNGADLGQPGSRRSHPLSSAATKFVRQIPRPRGLDSLSLADFVAGGNGFGQWVNWGIHPGDASFVPIRFNDAISSSGKFQWYTGDPQINGVFIPEGGDKPTPLDTAGHTFRFPKTRGTTFGPIWVSRASDREKASKEIMRRLGPHRVLLLHANAGITFDLVELKAAAAGRRPTRFQAVVVNQPHEAFDPTLGADAGCWSTANCDCTSPSCAIPMGRST